MCRQQYVAKGGPKKPANVPDHDPPQGYICYRCGEKGHWIQLCPTNDNPEYDNRPRVKRTTGIPRSFLKTVDKATALGQNADGEDAKAPSGIMVNADGEFVIAEPDKASWEQFQAKAKANPAAQKASAEEDKEVRERGLECPVDKKMFIEPMKTPCCETTYCNDCITNALIESDFVCPGCKSEGVLIDDLKADEEAVEKIKAYLAEKDGKAKEGTKSPAAPGSPAAAPGDEADNTKADTAAKDKSKSPSPTPAGPAATTTQPGQSTSASTTPAAGEQSQAAASKKRPAEDALENPKIPKAPKAMQKAQEAQQQQQQNMMGPMMNGFNPMMAGMAGMNGMNPMAGMPMMYPGMPMMGGNFGPMGGMPNMNMGMMNPMMNPMMAGFGGMNGMAGGGGPGGFNGGGWGGAADMGMNGMNPGGGNMGGGRMNGMGMGMGMGAGGGGGYGGGGGHRQGQGQGQQHHHQQQHFQHNGNNNHGNNHGSFGFQAAGGGEEDDAYFRKPVNPHRHQNRQRRVRPSDYREL